MCSQFKRKYRELLQLDQVCRIKTVKLIPLPLSQIISQNADIQLRLRRHILVTLQVNMTLSLLYIIHFNISWTKIDYQDKHCITDQTDKGT